jgi:plasmid stabilization system protein ParE
LGDREGATSQRASFEVKRVELTRGARLEIRACAHWYDEREAGLGEEFLDEIDRIVAKIADGASRYPLWRADRPYRKALVHRFPYVILVLVEVDVVRILAVAHLKRKPGYWLRRVR